MVLQTSLWMLGISALSAAFAVGNNLFSVQVGESVAPDLCGAPFQDSGLLLRRSWPANNRARATTYVIRHSDSVIAVAATGASDQPASFSCILEDGNHIVTTSVTDFGGQTGSDSTSVTIGSLSGPRSVSVSGFTYTTEGGRDGLKHPNVTVALVVDVTAGELGWDDCDPANVSDPFCK